MEQMETKPGSSNEGPIRSKYRGLSWDKKYQGVMQITAANKLFGSCTANEVWFVS